METMEEMMARHAQESAELEERIVQMVTTAKKSEKSRTQTRGEQMRSDLKATQQYELDSFGADELEAMTGLSIRVFEYQC
jgi:hypothetical protein